MYMIQMPIRLRKNTATPFSVTMWCIILNLPIFPVANRAVKLF